MKTYIIQLETHDDLVSARDKLAWAKAQRVLFIWPKRGKVLQDYYALSLLKREADQRGIELSFITKEREVRENARDLGVAVFTSVSQAERASWKGVPRKKVERQALKGYDELVSQRDQIHPNAIQKPWTQVGRIFLLMISLLAVFGLGAYFYPSAEVKIYPQRTQQTIQLAIQVNPAIHEVNLAGVIPGNLTEIELSGSRSGMSSGSMKVGAVNAKGWLNITNNSDSRILIPQGTRFTAAISEGKEYLSTADATIEAKGNASQAVPVEAVSAGADGNLPAGTAFTVQANWAGSVSISNTDAITGGTSVDTPTPTEADYQAMHDQLVEDLKNKASSIAEQQLADGEVLISGSLDHFEIESETRSIPLGTPSDRFSLEVKALFTVTSYSRSDLTFLAESILDANLNPNSKPVPGSLKVDDTSKVTDDASGTFGWNMLVSRLVERQFSADTLNQSLTGVPVAEVESIVEHSLASRAPSEVVLHPGWWKRMPFVAFRISILEQ